MTKKAENIEDEPMIATRIIYETLSSICNGLFEVQDLSRFEDIFPNHERMSDEDINESVKKAYLDTVDDLSIQRRDNISFRNRSADAVKLIMSAYPNSLTTFLNLPKWTVSCDEIKHFLEKGKNHFAIDDIVEKFHMAVPANHYPALFNVGPAVLRALPEGFYKDIRFKQPNMIALHSIIGDRLLKENSNNNSLKRLCVESGLGL